MLITTKLRIAAILPSVMALIIGVLLLVSFHSIRKLEEQERTAHRISESMGELNGLVRFYLLRHEERTRQQFLRKHEETTERIAAAAFENREHQRILKHIETRTTAVKGLFLKLVSNYERHGAPRDNALFREAEERLVGQLTIRSRDARTQASRLANRISGEIVAGQRRIYLLTLAIAFAATLPVTMILIGLMRNVVASLERVRRGTEIVGAGNLDHRIGISSKDEIGLLSQAFDRMSGNLQDTTVSRDKLAAEMEVRKRIEASLEKELEERRRAEALAKHLASFPQFDPNPVIELDASGRVVFCNPAAWKVLDILEMDKENVSVYLPEDMDEILGNWDGKKEAVLFREIALKNRIFAETVFLSPEFHVARIYAFDITRRKRAEEELRAAFEGLERRVAERTSELRASADRLREELAERRRAEESLRQSEERFRAVVEHSPVGIFIVRDGRIVYQNPEQSRLFGRMPEGLELREFRDVHPEDAARFGELVDSIAGGEPVREMDLRFYPYGRSADGVDLRWVHVNTIPMKYGRERSVLVRMMDVTRLKEMEHQYVVREKMASLGHVAAGIAHEIRNPLSGINIHLSALERIHEEADGLGAEGREQAAKVVRQIQSASDRIETVIRKVMEFSRPSSIRPDPADVSLAIESAIDFTATQLRKERIVLDRSGLGELPKCRVDPPLFTQVVMNLIINAAQALEKLEGPKVIGISSATEGDRIVVCVSDSGPGIPPAIRDRIFDPFFTTRKDGSGIGLSFCRRVIMEHGGILTADVGRLGGAEFRIELPLKPARKAVSVGTP